jgi:general stress protein YciG
MGRESELGARKNRHPGQNTSNRGFASMGPDQQREIASLGGKASHERGTAHEWNSREAREAGRKGGKARKRNV